MDCRNYQSQFTAYLDDDLSPGERGALQAHLKECLSCYRDWSLLHKTHEILERMQVLDPPQHLSALVLARVKDRYFRQRFRFPANLPRWLPLTAGVAVLLAISLTLWRLMPLSTIRQLSPPASQKSVVTTHGSSQQPVAEVPVTKRSFDSSGTVMVLKVKDFSRADQELDSMLRAFARPTPPERERESVRSVRSSSARLFDVQVPGQRLPHLLRELHKIGHLDPSQVESHTLDIPRHKKAISIRIVVVTNGPDVKLRPTGE